MTKTQERNAMSALRKAIRKAGGLGQLATICGTGYGNVWNWQYRDKKVPPDQAVIIERHTGIRKEKLCPDFPWSTMEARQHVE